MAVVPTPRRAAPRAPLALELTLSRAHGGPVKARTVDLCAGGCRVMASRPLRVDEELEFELVLAGGTHVLGRARVLREQATTYALRFERVRDEGAQQLADVVDAALR
jgi:hypothetical protein